MLHGAKLGTVRPAGSRAGKVCACEYCALRGEDPPFRRPVPGSDAASTDAIAPVRHPQAPAPGEPIGSHYAHCFGCGDEQPHGLLLQSRAGEGVTITAEFTVRPAHQGAPGLAHGGVLATALDESLGALQWLLRVIAVTGKLETDFVRPVPVGTVLFLTAEATAVSGRKIFCSATGRLRRPRRPRGRPRRLPSSWR